MVNLLFPSSPERVNVLLKPHSNRAEPTPLVKPLLGQGLASPLSCSGPLWLNACRIPPASPAQVRTARLACARLWPWL